MNRASESVSVGTVRYEVLIERRPSGMWHWSIFRPGTVTDWPYLGRLEGYNAWTRWGARRQAHRYCRAMAAKTLGLTPSAYEFERWTFEAEA